MLPYEAKLPVADGATLGRAVTKMLGVAEHLCLLSALLWSCPSTVSDLSRRLVLPSIGFSD
jgi:hypothetical protein